MKSTNRVFRLLAALMLIVSSILAPLTPAFAGTISYGMVDIAACDVYLAGDKKEGDKGKDGKGKDGKDGEEPDCE